MKRYKFFPNFISIIAFTFSFLILFFISTTKAQAAVTVTYYDNTPPASSLPACPYNCAQQIGDVCWNSQAVGTTDCGGACNGGSTWAKYNIYDCRQINLDGDCDARFSKESIACSTGDKYNSSNPPVMDAGKCSATAGSCDVGGAYKTCCSGGVPVGARSFQVDPYAPNEADCGGNTEVRCGNTAAGEPACGIAACGGPPTPTTTSTPTPIK